MVQDADEFRYLTQSAHSSTPTYPREARGRNIAKGQTFLLCIVNLNLKPLHRTRTTNKKERERKNMTPPLGLNLAKALRFLRAYIGCCAKSHVGLKGVEKTTPFRYTNLQPRSLLRGDKNKGISSQVGYFCSGLAKRSENTHGKIKSYLCSNCNIMDNAGNRKKTKTKQRQN